MYFQWIHCMDLSNVNKKVIYHQLCIVFHRESVLILAMNINSLTSIWYFTSKRQPIESYPSEVTLEIKQPYTDMYDLQSRISAYLFVMHGTELYDRMLTYHVRWNTTWLTEYSKIVMYNHCGWKFYKFLLIYRLQSKSDASSRPFTIVSDGIRFVYFYSKNDRNTEPCLTDQYGLVLYNRTISNVRLFAAVNELSTWDAAISAK